MPRCPTKHLPVPCGLERELWAGEVRIFSLGSIVVKSATDRLQNHDPIQPFAAYNRGCSKVPRLLDENGSAAHRRGRSSRHSIESPGPDRAWRPRSIRPCTSFRLTCRVTECPPMSMACENSGERTAEIKRRTTCYVFPNHTSCPPPSSRGPNCPEKGIPR